MPCRVSVVGGGLARRISLWPAGWLLVSLVLVLVLSSLANLGWWPARAAPSVPGLQISMHQVAERPLLELESAGRFALHLDTIGIVAWYDLRRDPQRQANLVLPGTHLLAERPANGAALQGNWTVLEANPVRVQVRWEGSSGSPSQPFIRTYTIWAAGAITVEIQSASPVQLTLQRQPSARTGATLQQQPAQQRADGTHLTQAMLFLDAWTGEDRVEWAARADTPNSLVARPADGALFSRFVPGTTLHLSLPTGVGLRQPRFVIADWPSAALTLRRAGRLLVAGQDYLAYWDAERRELLLHYLHLLPPGGSSAERTLELIPATAPPSLALGIAGRSLDEDGLLVVDANMPDLNATASLSDTFRIPYIQASPDLTATAVLQGGGVGVEFVLSNRLVQRVFGEPGTILQARFTLPAMGDYRLDAYILNADGTRLHPTPDDSIPVLSYGHVLLSVGDSITAGAGGDSVDIGEPSYPVSSYLQSPHYSNDRRNIYQYDNRLAADNPFFRSYQVALNDRLSTCSLAPIFILNDGFGSLRVSNNRAANANKNLLLKLPAYNDHIERYGVSAVLLKAGINDAIDNLPEADWSSDFNAAIDGLQTPNPGLTIWVARISWLPTSSSNYALNRIIAYNNLIPAIVQAQNSARNPVRLGPDFFAHFQANPDQISNDNLHPNQTGYNAIAALWAGTDYLCGALAPSTATPTPLPTITPTITATATPTTTRPPIAVATPTATTIPGAPEHRVRLPLVLR